MIRPEGFSGAAFGSAADGDGRGDRAARLRISAGLGISPEWAHVRQVHGVAVVAAEGPGSCGEADGLVTTVPSLPLVVATADCLPVVLEGDGIAGIAHAGWRGVAGGVVAATAAAMAARRGPPQRAAIGPAIGPCCFEVGEDVLAVLGDYASTTTWGTPSVDLEAAVSAQLRSRHDTAVAASPACTRCGAGFNSYRRDRTAVRQVSLAWLPPS